MHPTRLRCLQRIVSYPKYNGTVHSSTPVGPTHAWLGLTKPPSSSPPVNPSRPYIAPLPEGYSRTLHAAPAAYPREMAGTTGNLGRASHPWGEAPKGEDKEARSARVKSVTDELTLQRKGAKYWSLEEGIAAKEEPLWISAERWSRDNPKGGLTLVLTHACGFNKESWHPVIRDLLTRAPGSPGARYGDGAALSKPTNIVIDDIWLLEDTHHGASVDLNEGKLGPIHTWGDTARDVINFVQHVLPADSAEWELPWKEGKGNKVVGIGHSYGANALVQAAQARPDLFESLFLVEPMCPPMMINDPRKGHPLTQGALKRRSHWASRAAAAESRTNALFKSWDPAAFDLWLSHHLVPSNPAIPGGEVELSTPTWAEAAVFSDPHATLRGWDMLPTLGMPTGFLMAGDEFWMCGDEIANEMVWRPPHARNERLMENSHLLVQENPRGTADAIWRFLTTLQAGDWDKQ